MNHHIESSTMNHMNYTLIPCNKISKSLVGFICSTNNKDYCWRLSACEVFSNDKDLELNPTIIEDEGGNYLSPLE
jgi:hypothetical protein